MVTEAIGEIEPELAPNDQDLFVGRKADISAFMKTAETFFTRKNRIRIHRIYFYPVYKNPA